MQQLFDRYMVKWNEMKPLKETYDSDAAANRARWDEYNRTDYVRYQERKAAYQARQAAYRITA